MCACAYARVLVFEWMEGEEGESEGCDEGRQERQAREPYLIVQIFDRAMCAGDAAAAGSASDSDTAEPPADAQRGVARSVQPQAREDAEVVDELARRGKLSIRSSANAEVRPTGWARSCGTCRIACVCCTGGML